MSTDTLDLGMSPNAIRDAIIRHLAPDFSLMLWGKPGIGKSEVVAQAAATMKRRLIDIRLSLLDPVDMRGLPTTASGRTIWCPPSFLPSDPDDDAIVLLDELAQASISMQNAGLGLVLDRKIGEWTAPRGVCFIAASNRTQDRAGAGRMTTALGNRFGAHLTMEPSAADFDTMALDRAVHPGVRLYIANNPGDLHNLDPASPDPAFTSPRSLVRGASRVLHNLNGDVRDPSCLPLICGAIGQATGVKLVAFNRIFASLPDRALILGNASGAPVPSDPAVTFALTGALVEWMRAGTGAEVNALVDYTMRLPEEFQVVTFRDGMRVSAAVRDHQAVNRWIAKNVELLAGRVSK